MDANHFRQRAALAREMAKSGEDPRLAEMLLEVARDLDAEAEAIDAEGGVEPAQLSPTSCRQLFGSLIWPTDAGSDACPVRVLKLTDGGAKLQADAVLQAGADVILDLPDEQLRLSGRIIRSTGREMAMVFGPASAKDPALARYLRLQCPSKATEAIGA